MRKILLIGILMLFSIKSFAQTDREILLRIMEKQDKMVEQQTELAKCQAVTEAKIDGMQKQMDVRFDGVNTRFADVHLSINILMAIMIAMLTGMFGLIGFVIWDRQVSLKPMKEDSKELRKKMELALRKMGEVEPRFLETFRNAGIL